MASQLLKGGVEKEEEAFLKRLRLYVDKRESSLLTTYWSESTLSSG